MADGTLIFDTSLDTSGVEGGVKSLGSTMAGIGKTAAVGMATAVAAVGTATVATTKAIVDGAKETANYGDHIDKMSQKIGMSAEAYQEWDFILQQNGANVDSLQASMKTLSNAAVDNKDAFQQLGISEEFVKSASPEELFGEVITQLQGMEESTERTALASDLLGKSATELAPLLNSGAEATEELRKQAHEYGLVLDDESIKASAAFCDSLNLMEQTMNGMKNKLMAEFLPSLTEITDGLGKVFSGDMSGLDDIQKGIEDFIDSLSDALPRVMEVGVSIITSLASAIIQNIPMLVDAAIDLVGQLVGYILDNLPMLIETGLQVILQLALGIAQALPDLIPTIVEVILTIVEYLIDNIDLLVDAAIAIITGLAEGLINALPVLIEKAPVIIEKLVVALVTNAPKLLEAAVKVIETLATGLITNVPKLLAKIPQIMTSLKNGFLNLCSGFADVGKNIIDGLWNGIQSGWNWLTDKVSNLAKGLLDAAKSALGIASPSKEFRKIGEFCVAGFNDGIDDLMDGNKLASNINASLGTIQANVSGGQINGVGGGYTQVINVNREISTPDELARAVRLESRYGLMKGVAFG